MENWDQETLEKVVESKNKEYNQNKPTDIVCFPSHTIYFFNHYYWCATVKVAVGYQND